jgi:hypothetical protein
LDLLGKPARVRLGADEDEQTSRWNHRWHRVPPQAACSRGAGPPSLRPRAVAPSRHRKGVPCSSILPDCVRSLRPAHERSPFCILMARFATRAGGVLVGAGDGAVHAHLPLHLAHRSDLVCAWISKRSQVPSRLQRTKRS